MYLVHSSDYIHLIFYPFMYPSHRKSLLIVQFLAQIYKECKMSDWLGINDIVEVLEKVRVQVVVLSGQRVEVNHYIFLHCDVIHHMDEVQQGLHMQTQTQSVWHILPQFFTQVKLYFNLFQALEFQGVVNILQVHTHKIRWHVNRLMDQVKSDFDFVKRILFWNNYCILLPFQCR